MPSSTPVMVALSGGVDSAVAAWSLVEQGFAVECLHMSNWEDDDGYCDAATDLQDARAICDHLGLTLHRVNFAREYRETVFEDFLQEIRSGRTPNPDVLCNREIKFGLMRRYAHRLGAGRLATGHYARLDAMDGQPILLKGRDSSKDQSYFLHAVQTDDLTDVMFPLGELTKHEVRAQALRAGLSVSGKRDSTGICFIGERPFGEFLGRFIDTKPGPIVTEHGDVVGEHQGLHLYTLGQRKGIGVGGMAAADSAPWYVTAKRADENELVVVQGHDHPALFSRWIETETVHWIGPPPPEWRNSASLRCHAKTRYRQTNQPCGLISEPGGCARISFDRPQRAVTPGQYAVLYQGDRCLGGARIRCAGRGSMTGLKAAEAS